MINNNPKGMDDTTTVAWRQINSGDPAAVAQGNRTLLMWEQLYVVQPLYDQINNTWDGKLFTTALSYMTQSPIPGGRPFDDYPGNVTNFKDRWRWIEQDMLAKYLQLLQDPQQAQQLIDQPLRSRGDQFRHLPSHVDGY